MFKGIDKVINYVDSKVGIRRVESIFSTLKKGFAATFEVEGGSFVVTSIVGDTLGTIGFTNEEVERMSFMSYLGLSKESLETIVYKLEHNGYVLKRNRLRHRDGWSVNTVGVIYKISDTTLREIIMLESEFITI